MGQGELSLTGIQGIEQATHLLHAWLSTLNHVVDRSLAGEDGRPSIRSSLVASGTEARITRIALLAG
jgi:hypothetical protein